MRRLNSDELLEVKGEELYRQKGVFTTTKLKLLLRSVLYRKSDKHPFAVKVSGVVCVCVCACVHACMGGVLVCTVYVSVCGGGGGVGEAVCAYIIICVCKMFLLFKISVCILPCKQ